MLTETTLQVRTERARQVGAASKDKKSGSAIDGQQQNASICQGSLCVSVCKICEVSTFNHPLNEQEQQIKPRRIFTA